MIYERQLISFFLPQIISFFCHRLLMDIIFLPHIAYDVVKEALGSLIHVQWADGSSVGLDFCFHEKRSLNSIFSALTFHFKEGDYIVIECNYLLDTGNGIICLAMALNMKPDVWKLEGLHD